MTSSPGQIDSERVNKIAGGQIIGMLMRKYNSFQKIFSITSLYPASSIRIFAAFAGVQNG